MTIGRILFENQFRNPDNTGFSYSGAEVSGFEKENAIDWRDFSLFRIATGIEELDITMDVDTVIDTFGWYVPPLDANRTITLVLKYESAPAVFTSITDFISSSDDLLGMKSFDPVTVLAGRILRVETQAVLGAQNVRQITVGKRLDFPIGQHRGIRPPTLRGSFVTSNVIAVDGSFLGRDKVRADIQGDIELEFLQPQTFVRDLWVPFMEHAERFAFYYAWDLDGFPDEVVFAWARDTPRPLNSGPQNKMSVSLPWSALAE